MSNSKISRFAKKKKKKIEACRLTSSFGLKIPLSKVATFRCYSVLEGIR